MCDRLDLEWEEIVAEPASELEANLDNSIDIDAIVQGVREKIKPIIQQRCGTMRVLDMTQPIGLNDIYTSVNILDKITGQRRLGIDELLQQCKSQDFDFFGLNRITEKRLPGLEAVEKYSKLMILGKPGAGKTTFLKYLAIQCIGGEFQAERVPIFVTLKNFAETENKPGLLQHITEETINPISSIQDVLTYGKALVLLDGLDEVREEDSNRVLKEIREFSDRYPKNQFVMTCRIAAREYTFEKFTEVEVADFDDDQISNFANNWFKKKAVKPETFIKRLEENSRIKELAASPLLLTLLCLAFEESGDFPANRSELYKEGLDALLKKWDAKRGIQRDQIYKKLSVQRKEDLLSKIALTTFEGSEYFFKQKVAEQYITEYIRNLPDANTDEEALQVDSEQVLRSIEHHHGLVVARAKRIYSFSHLTFHEYFTAREFVVVRQSSEEALQNLVSHITEKRWREVFLLAVGMSPSADRLLIFFKDKIDAIVAEDEKIQQLLMWSSEKSVSVDVRYKKVITRAFYFAFATRGQKMNSSSYQVLRLVFLYRVIFNNLSIAQNFIHENFINIDKYEQDKDDIDLSLIKSIGSYVEGDDFEYDCCIAALAIAPKTKQALLALRKKLLTTSNKELFQKWWQANRLSWTEQFKAVMIQYHNIAPEWQLSVQQKELLQQYYYANQLLISCLNSDCYVSLKVRQEIEYTLLLPIAEIKQRQQQR
ncbi:hypothetical protein A4S05_18920 [Nostoc sp. KVJ20]|nr:hypothetical protein A4S05_18920 [Nostoc sp. KVJ20]